MSSRFLGGLGNSISFRLNSAETIKKRTRSKSRGSDFSNRRGLRKNVAIVKMGVGKWVEVIDYNQGFGFFYNTSSKISSWYFPLCFIKNPGVADKKEIPTEDKLVLKIAPKTFHRYFLFTDTCAINTRLPDKYSKYVKKLDYFKDKVLKTQKMKKKELSSMFGALTPLTDITCSMVLENVSLYDVLQSPNSCAGLYDFLVTMRAEENFLFYAACELYENGAFQGQTVLGQRSTKTLEEGQQQLFIRFGSTKASVRMGFVSEKGQIEQWKSMKERATNIFDKFIKKGSPLWVCLSDVQIHKIEEKLEEADNKTVLFGLFEEAKDEVYENMKSAVYNDFVQTIFGLKTVLGHSPEKSVIVALVELCRKQMKL